MVCLSALLSLAKSLKIVVDGPQAEELLRPVFMGCSTRNPKVVTIALSSLQRLVAMKAVPMSTVPHVVATLADCISQGVDVQLRILQTLLSLLTNFTGVHGPLLGDVRKSIHLLVWDRLNSVSCRRYFYASSYKIRG
jgi:Mon2/Sec7/BIG1-like, dimerisation and cyclophilin-binding domain